MTKVSVCMITYNHANYIEKAIESILSQIGNFEIELVIANDNSPDNTDEIIKACIQNNNTKHKIKYIHNTKNIGMMPNFEQAINACDGDFLAICEGDDYWTSPNKIEEQVSFLSENNDNALLSAKALAQSWPLSMSWRSRSVKPCLMAVLRKAIKASCCSRASSPCNT